MSDETKPAEQTLRIAIIPVTPLQQNCSIVWDDKTKVGAVVDPGGDIATIQRAINEIGLKIEQIVLTHGHIDHAGGAADLKAALKVDVVGPHKDDKFLLDGLEAQGKDYGIPEAKNVSPDRWLDEGDEISIAGHKFDVRHCPGHAPGHVVFINHEYKIILIGDVLFKGSIGRTDFPYGDHEALISAIKTKILPLGDDYAFVCGHGPTSTVGDERNSNPFIQA